MKLQLSEEKCKIVTFENVSPEKSKKISIDIKLNVTYLVLKCSIGTCISFCLPLLLFL